MAKEEINKIEAKSLSHLPPTASENDIEKWLIYVRLALFNEKLKKPNEPEKSKEVFQWSWKSIPAVEWTEELIKKS